MNKAALLTTAKKFQSDEDLYLISVFDLEPSGIIVHAYNQINSHVLMLPVSEMEVRSQRMFLWIEYSMMNLLCRFVDKKKSEITHEHSKILRFFMIVTTQCLTAACFLGFIQEPILITLF